LPGKQIKPNQPLKGGPVHSDPGYYEIRIRDRLSEQAAIWFEDMTLSVDEETTPPQTIIHGYILDQAALYGLISRVRDLGLTLISVKRLNSEEESKVKRTKGDADDLIEN
jgi:hypothetical protein